MLAHYLLLLRLFARHFLFRPVLGLVVEVTAVRLINALRLLNHQPAAPAPALPPPHSALVHLAGAPRRASVGNVLTSEASAN